MKLRYKNIMYFIILIIFLVIPFIIKSIDYHFELFPAVILPAGSSQCNLKDNVIISVKEIYGITPDGVTKKLDKSTFIKKVRVEYFSYLYSNRFGLTKPKDQHLKTTRLQIPFTIKSKITNEDIKATKKWLRARLIEQHCIDSFLILKKKKIVVFKNGAYHEEKHAINDTILSLY